MLALRLRLLESDELQQSQYNWSQKDLALDIPAALSAINGTLAIAKELRSIDASMAQAELKLKVIDLIDGIVEAKTSLHEMAEEVRSRGQRIQELEVALHKKSTDFNDEGVYRYFKNSAGRSIGPPICPLCEAKGTFIQLAMAVGGMYRCPACEKIFGNNVKAYQRE